ncbi:MAG: redoxin domain-containing protein [Cyanobacteria bacterium P01_A01_bin.135]
MLTSTNFTGLINPRFFKNLLPVPASRRVQTGALAPPFQCPAVSGEMVRLREFVGPGSRQQPVLLVFTRIFTEHQYCPLCYPHIVALRDAYAELTARGVALLMVTSTDAEQSAVVASDLKLPMPLLMDPSCHGFRAYGTGQALGAPLPAQFLIDGEGYVRFHHFFSFLEPNASLERIHQAIDSLFAHSSPDAGASLGGQSEPMGLA